MDPGHFLDEKIRVSVPEKDYHRIFFGRILRVLEA